MTDIDEATEEAITFHSFDGKKCTKCGKRHHFLVKSENPVPDNILNELSRLVDVLPEEIVDAAGASNGETGEPIANAFLKLAQGVRKLNAQAPAILAIAEVLDEQTQGAVTKRLHVFRAENDVVNLHLIRKLLNNFIEWLHSFKGSNGPPEDVFEAMNDVMDYVDERLQHYVDAYTEVCQKENHSIDQNVIDHGCPNEDRELARFILHTNLETDVAVRSQTAALDIANDSDS